MNDLLRGYNSGGVRSHNRSLVLRILRGRGPISRRQISALTGLQPATITNLVDGLLEEGLVAEVGNAAAGSSAGGRPQVLLDLKPGGALVAGVQLGIRSIAVAFGDHKGTLYATTEVAHPEGLPAEESLAMAAGAVRELLAADDVAVSSLHGLGMSLPTIVDPGRGIARHARELGWSVEVPVAALLSDELDLPVFADNSRRAMMLAESAFGAVQAADNAVLVHVGTTVGAALLLERRTFYGDNSAAARIDHTIVEPDGPECSCGGRGCLSAVAGEKRMLERWRLADPQIDRDLEPAVLYRRAQDGDPVAVEIVADAARAIGAALVHALLLLDCHVVVVAGPVLFAEEAFLRPLREAIEPHVHRVTGAVPIVLPSSFGTRAQLAGAVSVALEQSVYKQTRPRSPSK